MVVRDAGRHPRFATRDLLKAERRLQEAADRSRTHDSHGISQKTLAAVCGKRTLTPEQEAALREITAGSGSIKCVEGMAGTGKTYLLAAAREAWEKEGYRVVGGCLSARAARQLEADSHIKSMTLKAMLWHLAPPLADRAWHGTSRLLREATLNTKMAIWGLNARQQDKVRKKFSKHDRPLGGLKLDKKTIVVLDEAGMVDLAKMERLVQHVMRAGAKLVVVGDPRQLQSIDAGAPFRLLIERLGAAKLTEIIRQYEPWMAHAVHQFADGDARGALSQYALAGKLRVEETRAGAIQKLIRDWSDRRTADLKETLILAGTRAEVQELNLFAQECRRIAGEVAKRSIKIGGQNFHEGDRVLFTKNNRALGVANGDFGTIENIRGVLSSPLTPVIIRLDRLDEHGKPLRVTFTPVQYTNLQLGYAVTTHKAQGATVDKSFVLAGGWMQDREISYVQMSRHREEARVYASRADAGEDLSALSDAMARSRMKDTAIDRSQWSREQEANR